MRCSGIFTNAGSPRWRARSQKARRIDSARRWTVSGEERRVFLEVEVLKDIRHLDQADAAGTGRRRAIDVMAAIDAMNRFALLPPCNRSRSSLVISPPPAFISAAIKSATLPL